MIFLFTFQIKNIFSGFIRKGPSYRLIQAMQYNKVPKGWTDYSSMGKRIEGTPFVAFKVPLKDSIIAHLPDDAETFTPQDVMNSLPDLSTVIDLTNVHEPTRYYDPQEFIDNNIRHRRVQSTGRGVIPSQRQINRFYHFVDEHLKLNPDKLIGVHCTHGLNRTGFFICSYLINKLNYINEDALKVFEESRGHKMVRQNYVDELMKEIGVQSNQIPDSSRQQRHGFHSRNQDTYTYRNNRTYRDRVDPYSRNQSHPYSTYSNRRRNYNYQSDYNNQIYYGKDSRNQQYRGHSHHNVAHSSRNYWEDPNCNSFTPRLNNHVYF